MYFFSDQKPFKVYRNIPQMVLFFALNIASHQMSKLKVSHTQKMSVTLFKYKLKEKGKIG